jgi:hypothetical protein
MKQKKMNLAFAILSIPEIAKTMRISKHILDVLQLLNITYIWQLYVWKFDAKNNPDGAPFWEQLSKFNHVGPKSLEEFKSILDVLNLPDVDTYIFSDDDLQIVKQQTTDKLSPL